MGDGQQPDGHRALTANLAIAVAKLAAAPITGSTAMSAEAAYENPTAGGSFAIA